MVVLVDSSAWIEFLRKTGSSANKALRRAIDADEVATTDAVVLEVLVGARDDLERRRLSRMLASCLQLPQEPWDDVQAAAMLYLTCRRAGDTPRSSSDCLIAAVAIRADVPVLHRDRDFGVIARHTSLRLAT